MSTWIAEKDSMKLHNQRRKIFLEMWQWRAITEADYIYAKDVWKEFGTQNLYVQSNILLLADVFENFQSKCIEIYKLDSAFFLLALRLAWHVFLTKTKDELELLMNLDTVLTIEKGILSGMYCAMHR